MTAERIPWAPKTTAAYTCLVCGYTGPMAYGEDGYPMCQSCQYGYSNYMLPNCPQCGTLIGCDRPKSPRLKFTCPACGKHWEENPPTNGSKTAR